MGSCGAVTSAGENLRSARDEEEFLLEADVAHQAADVPAHVLEKPLALT